RRRHQLHGVPHRRRPAGLRRRHRHPLAGRRAAPRRPQTPPPLHRPHPLGPHPGLPVLRPDVPPRPPHPHVRPPQLRPGPPRHHVAVSSEALTGFVRDVDVLVHEAQYTNEEYPAKIGWGHSSLSNACALARLGGVRRWIVTHHDPAHNDDLLSTKLLLTRQI